MRLSKHTITIIRQAAQHHFGSPLKIWLFGSRVDDDKRGGDIDLYLELDTPITERVLKSCRMNAEIQSILGEQKIDILVYEPSQKHLRIYDIAKETGVLL